MHNDLFCGGETRLQQPLPRFPLPFPFPMLSLKRQMEILLIPHKAIMNPSPTLPSPYLKVIITRATYVLTLVEGKGREREGTFKPETFKPDHQHTSTVENASIPTIAGGSRCAFRTLCSKYGRNRGMAGKGGMRFVTACVYGIETYLSTWVCVYVRDGPAWRFYNIGT